jgi:uncharacterized protein YneF (UPF0154 family)
MEASHIVIGAVCIGLGIFIGNFLNKRYGG